MNSSIKWG